MESVRAGAAGTDPGHAAAVAALQRYYAALPPGTPVRLGKRTTNLFRFRRPSAAAARLPADRFDRVLRVDPQARTADVQGMTTYETLVAATLPHGLMPTVVPQLKTITVGGAVAGLGVESTSFRHGLPHEAVLEMEILTPDGRVVVATEDGPYADLFAGFPNSYGTLGYALRLTLALVPAPPFVHLRHLRYADPERCLATLAEICRSGTHDGEPVDAVDGTAFSPDELYLTLARFTDVAPPQTSDYTGQQIYYRSLQRRAEDHLTMEAYLWRWDTDWFWCSRGLGVQHPVIRRLWPRRLRRSDVYRRLVGLDRRFRLSDRWQRLRGLPAREMVVQDVEIPVERTAEFLRAFDAQVGMRPVWLCPVRVTRPWPLYPMEPGRLYVNVGFWGTVPRSPGQPADHHNRLVEQLVDRLDGHKGLYSTVHWSPEEFWRRYNGEVYAALKRAYDPDGRLPDLYDKCVRQT